jgi:hypothetical protein
MDMLQRFLVMGKPHTCAIGKFGVIVKIGISHVNASNHCACSYERGLYVIAVKLVDDLTAITLKQEVPTSYQHYMGTLLPEL